MDVTDIYHDGAQYDLMFGGYADGEDLNFYARQAELSGGDVLELGCGTGRLTIPMARRSFSVTGLDLSKSMLKRAREKSAEQGVSVEWVHADCRDFDLGRTFELIFFPANSFQSLLDRPAQEACLDCVKRHLALEGRFVLEVYNPSLRLLMRDPSARLPIQTCHDPKTGGTVTVTESVAYDPATQISHAAWLYEREGDAEHATAHLPLRVIHPQELDALLHYNGLDIEAKCGDFTGGAFTSASVRQIVVCRVRR